MELILCPRCEGQQYDEDACGVCDDIGLLNEHGDRLDGAELRALLTWLEAWQVNFPKYVSEGEPRIPRRFYPRTKIVAAGLSGERVYGSRPQGLTG